MKMNKTLFISAALLLIAACQSVLEEQVQEEPGVTDEIVVEEGETKIPAPDITAAQEGDNPTKSVLEVDGNGVGTIYWTPADEINVFYGTTSTHYVSQNTANATTAVFSTTDVIGSTESASDNIWGLYPYNSSATCTGSAVTTTLPATQYGVPGTFDDDLFITVAHNTNTNLQFYNVCGGIKFSLSRGDIQHITLTSPFDYSEDIAGSLTITFKNGEPNVTTSGTKTIYLAPRETMEFIQGQYYYFVLPPTVFTGGIIMTFSPSSVSSGNGYLSISKPVTIKRSIFGKKDNIDVYATGLSIPDNQIWYTSINASVVNPKTSGGSKGLLNGSDAAVDIRSNEYYSTGQGRIICEESIVKLDQNVFSTKSSLESIILPSSVTRIGQGAFNSCTNLTSITFPASLRTISTSAFLNCSSLASVVFPESVTTIDTGAFSNCTSLSTVSFLGNNLTRISENAFYNTRINEITLPASLVYIYKNAFASCSQLTSMTLLGTTPPSNPHSYPIGIEESNFPIYVPSEAVDAYKTDPIWSACASRIQAIP